MKKILIFHTAFIGDIVLSTALVKNIKKLYPQTEITFVTTPAGKAILSNNPHLKEVIAYDKRGKNKGIKGMLSLAKELRKKRFDIAYIPHRYLRSSLVCFLAKIPSRIGYVISEGKLFLNRKVAYRKDLHEVDRLLELLGTDCDDKKLELFPSDEDKRYIDNFLLDKDIKGKKLIALAIGSKWNTKRWPIEYFNELIEKLEKIEDIKLILVGGNEEKELSVKYTDKTINAIGETSLLQLAELIRRCDLIVTNDSSPIHIASAFDTYIMAIFGATVKELGFYPWSKNSEVIENNSLTCRPCGLHGGNECPLKHFKCMLEIKSDFVYERILAVLKEKESENPCN